MGNRHDDRSARPDSTHQGRPEPGRHRTPESEQGRAFDRSEDMGGSGWSGASGRGGMSYGEGEYLQQGAYPREGGFQREDYSQQGGPSHPYPRDPGYPRDGGYRQGGYGHHEPHGLPREGSYPREGADNAGGYPRESGFPRELGFGHIPGQRWSGGYGGDFEGGPGSIGRGFTGSDFGPPSQSRPPGQRHFGNVVDRGSRMSGGPPLHDRQRGEGTDMGVGASGEDRGAHYGKGPKGYKRSDARIHDEVCEAIAHQGHIDASDVEVKVVSGIVTLAGTVAHREDKRGLEHLVERLRGVDEVHNELRLKRPVARETVAKSAPVTAGYATDPRGNGGDPKDQKNGESTRG